MTSELAQKRWSKLRIIWQGMNFERLGEDLKN